MPRFTSLRPPDDDTSPTETFRWLRKLEIGYAVLGVVLAAYLWDEETLRWILLATAALSLSPWPGAGALVRKARRDPERYATSPPPDVAAARARRFMLVSSPIFVLCAAGIGFAIGGLAYAVIEVVVLGPTLVLGYWLATRRRRP